MSLAEKYITKPLDKVGNAVSGAAGAAGFSQIPGYIGPYTQRLGGHLSEAMGNVSGWQNIADKTTNGCLDTLVDAYNSATNLTFLETGKKSCLWEIRAKTDIPHFAAVVWVNGEKINSSIWKHVVVEHDDKVIVRLVPHGDNAEKIIKVFSLFIQVKKY